MIARFISWLRADPDRVGLSLSFMLVAGLIVAFWLLVKIVG